MSRRILLLVLTSALALVLGFWAFTPAQGVEVIRWGGYWMMLATTLAFGVTLVRSLRSDAPGQFRPWRGWIGPVAVALAAAGFLHLHERHEFKVVADEVVLQITARQMHFHREASAVVRGYDIAGNFEPLLSYVDKRPLLFPFLLATVHDLTGFRVANGLALNGALSGLLMLLVLLIGRRVGGWPAGIAAVLLLATIPLIAQNACGSGFELLNLVMLALTIWLGMRAADAPDDDDRLGAFVLSGVLLAQVRYESALFILPVAGTMAYLWWRQREIRLPWTLLLAPLLLVPCALLLDVFRVSQASWQLNDIAGADHPFALRYFYDNVGHALNFFLCVDGTQSNSVLVFAGGVLGIGLFLLLLFREHRRLFREQPALAVLAVFLLGLLLHAFVMLCYFWGRWDDTVIRRLSLPTNLLLVLALVFVWPRLIPIGRRWWVLSGIALLYLAGMTIPTNAMHRYNSEYYAARSTNWLGGWIRSFGDRPILAIDGSSGLQWFLYGQSSVTPETLAVRADALLFHFRNRTFDQILVVQRVTPVPGTGVRSVNLRDDLGEGVKLETIEEKSFAPLYSMRLARIVAIDEPKFRAWAKLRAEHPLVPVSRNATTTAAAKAQEDELKEWMRQLP